jgi:hypothetical protein
MAAVTFRIAEFADISEFFCANDIDLYAYFLAE